MVAGAQRACARCEPKDCEGCRRRKPLQRTSPALQRSARQLVRLAEAAQHEPRAGGAAASATALAVLADDIAAFATLAKAAVVGSEEECGQQHQALRVEPRMLRRRRGAIGGQIVD